MRTGPFALAAAAVGLTAGAYSRADQFVMVDHVATFPASAGELAAFSYWTLQPKAPTNWEEPVNYRDGTCYIRFEVLEKEEPGPIRYQVCWFGNHGLKHVCSERPESDAVGVLETDQVPGKMWRNHPTWDWTNAVRRGFVRIWHPSEKNYRDTLYREMRPIKVHVTVTIVPSGATYRPHGTYGGLRYASLKRLKAVAAYLEQGRLGPALRGAQRELDSDDPERAEEAGRVIQALDKYAETRRSELARTKASQPLYAIEALARLAAEFNPSEKAKRLMAEARAWDSEPATVQEKRARRILQLMKKTAGRLEGKLRGKRATDPDVARRYGGEIAAIKSCVAALKQNYPETPSCGRAMLIVERLGISVPE